MSDTPTTGTHNASLLSYYNISSAESDPPSTSTSTDTDVPVAVSSPALAHHSLAATVSPASVKRASIIVPNAAAATSPTSSRPTSPPTSPTPTSPTTSTSHSNPSVAALMSRFAESHTDLNVTGRTLIKEGPLVRQARFKSASRWLMLFNDILVLSKPYKSETFKTTVIKDLRLTMKQILDLRFVSADDGGVKNVKKPHLCINYTRNGTSEHFQLSAADMKDKAEWIHAINQASAQYKLATPHTTDIIEEPKDKKSASPRKEEATVHSSVLEGQDDVLLHLLSEKEHDANAKDTDGNAAIHHAIRMSNANAVAFLMAHGADINLVDGTGNTPLHLAGLYGEYGIAMMLIAKRANVEALNGEKLSCLWVAAEHAQDQRSKGTLTPHQGISPATSPRSDSNLPTSPSSKLQTITITQKDIDDAAAQDSDDDEDETDEESVYKPEPSPTAAAAPSSEPTLSTPARPSVTLKADDYQKADREEISRSALLHDIIKLMMEYGADIECRNAEGLTILQYLSARDRAETVDILLRCGASHGLSLLTTGETALHLATKADALATVKVLLSYGAAPNLRDHGLNTPLHLATSIPIAACLIVNGARMDLKNVNGQKAIHYFENLAQSEADEASRLLKEARDAFLARSQTVLDTGDNKSDWVGDKISDACLLCNCEFTLTKRRHHCRRCGLLVCALCSSKKAHPMDKPLESYRTCDSCYNLLVFKAAIQGRERRKKRKEDEAKEKEKQAKEAKEREELLAKQAAQQEELAEQRREFEARRAEQSAKIKTLDDKRKSALNTSNDLQGTMSKNKQMLTERGEKLSEMENKAESLANEASNFASMAEQLKKKQQSKWF